MYIIEAKLSRMESIMTWAKENYDLITLMVGFVGVVIAFINLICVIKKKKKGHESERTDIR